MRQAKATKTTLFLHPLIHTMKNIKNKPSTEGKRRPRHKKTIMKGFVTFLIKIKHFWTRSKLRNIKEPDIHLLDDIDIRKFRFW